MANPEMYDFLKILVSVSLGMFGKAIFDYIKDSISRRRDRRFVVEYLTNAKSIFPILKKDYEKAQKIVLKSDLEVYDLGVFEGFNTAILSSLSFPRFYEIFKKNATPIYRIYGMVNAIQKDLPIPIYEKFAQAVGTIYKNKSQDVVDDLLNQQRKIAILTTKLKLVELNLLEASIDDFLSKV